jgi:hypothetical protein
LSGDNVRIRVRSGQSEVEVEASVSKIHDAINLIPELVAKLPTPAVAPPPQQPAPQSAAPPQEAHVGPASLPVVSVEKGDSLSDVILKFFADSWGRNPRKLQEVREALQSYGLNYPKQSVAVALLRLAKGSRIRRFKGDGGEYVYTWATGTVPPPVVAEPAAAPVAEEEQLELETGATG